MFFILNFFSSHSLQLYSLLLVFNKLLFQSKTMRSCSMSSNHMTFIVNKHKIHMKLIKLHLNDSSTSNNIENFLFRTFSKYHRLQIPIEFRQITSQIPNHHIYKSQFGTCGTQSVKSKSKSIKISKYSYVTNTQ